jgi:hypothetical protein
LQRKRVLAVVGVFLATLPISYILNGLINLGLPISDALVRLGVYWGTAAGIAYLLLTILTSLLFSLIAWLFLKAKDESATKGIR